MEEVPGQWAGSGCTSEKMYFKTVQQAAAYIDGLLSLPLLAQLHALLKSGLVPFSMAGDLSEPERKAACDMPIVTFTLGGAASASTAGAEMFAKTAGGGSICEHGRTVCKDCG